MRQVFADRDAGHARRDGLELPRDLGGGVGLHVERVVVRHATGEVDHDDRLVRADPRALLCLQELRQRETAESERADLEEGAARDAVAEASLVTEQREHVGLQTFGARMDSSIRPWVLAATKAPRTRQMYTPFVVQASAELWSMFRTFP